MATSGREKKENKNLRALFSVICLSIIALGMIVYFSTQTVGSNSSVGEQTTLKVEEKTSQVQNRVEGVSDTTKSGTTKNAEKETTKKKESKKESPTMEMTDTNTPFKSFYKYPIDESVLSGFSEELTLNKTMGDYRAHGAVDFKGSLGCKVSAVNDGLVLQVQKDTLLGSVITIDHGGNFIVKYCGLDVMNVSAGDYVTMGQNIGTLGVVPFEAEDEAHLHLEATINGETINPLDVMGKTD